MDNKLLRISQDFKFKNRILNLNRANKIINRLYDEAVKETLTLLNIEHVSEGSYGRGYVIVEKKFKQKLEDYNSRKNSFKVIKGGLLNERIKNKQSI